MCDSNGQIIRTEMCGFGCVAAGDACVKLDPSNDLAGELDRAATEPAVTFDPTIDITTIDTDTGTVMHGGIVLPIPSVVKMQPGLPDIRVFRMKSLVIQNPVTVSGRAALAIVSDGDVEISSPVTLDVTVLLWGGPGAVVDMGASCRGQDSTGPGNGGAGFGSAGGSGGNASDTNGIVLGGAGGSVAGNETLVPLRGGCPGGGVSREPFGGPSFGGGGGALQISSRTQIRVTTGGAINAGGGGGSGGGSGGGGSGGGILLEASMVNLAGTVAANGGGGGCAEQDGQSGRIDHAPAQGGFCNSLRVSFEGDGGTGGIGGRAAKTGGSAIIGVATFVQGGGGGGSVGRIRVNTRTGAFTRTGSAAWVSPAASTGIARTR